MAARTVLESIRDRLKSLYWTPQVTTVEITSAVDAALYELKIGSGVVRYTASVPSDTTDDIAAAIAAAAKNTTARGFYGLSDISVAGSVLTLTGGPAPFTVDVSGSTTPAHLTIATPTPSAREMFMRVIIAPPFAIAEVMRHLTTYPFAVISEAGAQSNSFKESNQFEDLSLAVTVISRRPRDREHDADMVDDEGSAEMADRIRFVLVRAYEFPAGTIVWNSTGAEATTQAPNDPTGYVGKSVLFTVVHPIVGR